MLVGVSAVQVDHTDVLMGVSAPLVGVFPVIVTDRSLVYLDPTVGEVQSHPRENESLRRPLSEEAVGRLEATG